MAVPLTILFFSSQDVKKTKGKGGGLICKGNLDPHKYKAPEAAILSLLPARLPCEAAQQASKEASRSFLLLLYPEAVRLGTHSTLPGCFLI